MDTARDIMNRDVITIRQGASVGNLIRLLDEHGIGGVPVVDTGGVVVGVVSRTDVIRLATQNQRLARPEKLWQGLGRGPLTGEEDAPGAYFIGPERGSAALVPGLDPFEGDPLEERPVDDIMTPVAFSVEPEMTVPRLARFLLNGRIHRALVVEDGHLVGLVSAFDVLRVVAEG